MSSVKIFSITQSKIIRIISTFASLLLHSRIRHSNSQNITILKYCNELKFYFLNIIQRRVPTKIPTARTIMIGTMNSPSFMYFIEKSLYLVKYEIVL